MTKRERVLAAVAGEPVDRTPYSLWYHFRLDPPAGQAFAAAELAFYRRCDPDLFKVMHDIPYEMPADMPEVREPADWARLPVLDGRSGNFGQQLDAIKQIVAEKGDDGPVVDTVFGAFATAEKVSGKRTLEHLAADPEPVRQGLRAIAASLANYARALLEAGADGIYLAVAGAASDTMPADQYAAEFAALDQQVLDAVDTASVNVVHHHGVGIYPEVVLPYKGMRIYCWSNRLEGNPSIREMRLRTRLCLMAGVNEVTYGEVTPDFIVAEARSAIAESGGRAFILAPGCAIPTPPATPDANLDALRLAVGA